MHHIAIGDDIILAFQAEFARIAGARFALVGDIIAIGDGFGADIALLEIGMNDAGGLRALSLWSRSRHALPWGRR